MAENVGKLFDCLIFLKWIDQTTFIVVKINELIDSVYTLCVHLKKNTILLLTRFSLRVRLKIPLRRYTWKALLNLRTHLTAPVEKTSQSYILNMYTSVKQDGLNIHNLMALKTIIKTTELLSKMKSNLKMKYYYYVKEIVFSQILTIISCR